MNVMVRAILLSAAALMVGCTSTSPTGTVGVTPGVASTPSPRALAALQTRDRTVRIFAGGGGLQVTVHDDLGNLVADRVSLEKMRAIDPFLYELCTSAVARTGPPERGSYLDARLYISDVARGEAGDRPLAP
jgi:type IV pilus biogenesis protein CpaD/CtpE